jgi:hypothetical protein
VPRPSPRSPRSPATLADQLRDPEDFPALYGSADQASMGAQASFLRWLRIRLGGLLLAVVGAVIAWKHGDFEIGGFVAVLAFGAALVAELYLAIQRPERAWYEGRAAAESAKTLAWRYVVKGESFDVADQVADERFLEELKEILQDLKDIDLASAESASGQITDVMISLRAQDFARRRDLYLQGRIEDQRGWYSRKAVWNKHRANLWIVVSLVAEVAGLVLGAAKAFGHLHLDLLSVCAAIAATVTAWAQAKQHQNLATAYGVTAQELAAVASELRGLTDESNWARFVGQAEEAISREHTLWRASRGIGVSIRRRALP